jgi:uncharacterized membrane protein
MDEMTGGRAGFDHPGNAAGASGVEQVIAHLLLWGGLVSALLVLLGLALYAGGGGFHGQVLTHHRLVHPDPLTRPPHVFVSFADVMRGLSATPMDPLAITALGVMLLLMTPVLGVLSAIPAFLSIGDRRYAAIATIVFSMFAVSLLLAGGAG